MFVAASSRCFSDKSFSEACSLISDLEYDKIEIWMSEGGSHLKTSVVAKEPEQFASQFREMSRLTPVALHLQEDVDVRTLAGVARVAKQLRVTQITVPASPLGTPFNSEIDRLRAFLKVVNPDGVRLSLKTQTGMLTEDAHTAVELCQAVPGLGLTLDPSYYICGPHRGVSFDQVFPYVYHVHLRDSTPEQLQVQIGLGEIDYSRMIAMLRRNDYQRALSVDLIYSPKEEMNRPLEMRKLRMLLDTLL
ncbi:MAG: TIM barrel protein [Planctomycetaceae bacterium]